MYGENLEKYRQTGLECYNTVLWHISGQIERLKIEIGDSGCIADGQNQTDKPKKEDKVHMSRHEGRICLTVSGLSTYHATISMDGLTPDKLTNVMANLYGFNMAERTNISAIEAHKHMLKGFLETFEDVRVSRGIDACSGTLPATTAQNAQSIVSAVNVITERVGYDLTHPSNMTQPITWMRIQKDGEAEADAGATGSRDNGEDGEEQWEEEEEPDLEAERAEQPEEGLE